MSLLALVVDDSMLIRHTVCRFLEERGFTVAVAANGLEALESVKCARPDIVFTDMKMPKMGGSELITTLREIPAMANIPIVVATGRRSHCDKKDERASFFIFKDIDIEKQLANALEQFFGPSSTKGQAAGE